jgi:prepilin peptidase CpaA
VTLLIACVTLTLLLVAAAYDLRTREVPDWVALALLAWAALATALGWHTNTWWSLAAGLTIGAVVGGLFFYLGGGLGGADVKLITALGAVAGPAGLISALFWMALAGGALALLAAARRQRTFAYVPAIVAGWLIYTLWPGAIGHVLAR